MPNSTEAPASLTVKNKQKLGFEWSLKPNLILMHLVGVPLYFQSSQHFPYFIDKCRWWSIRSLGFFIFLLNIEFQSNYIVNAIFSVTDPQQKREFHGRNSSIILWNDCIDKLNSSASYLSSHLMIMIFLLTKWRKVTKVLNCMEQQMSYNQMDYRKFRVASMMGLVASVTVGLNYIPKFEYFEGVYLILFIFIEYIGDFVLDCPVIFLLAIRR